ncbi:MAG: GspE/PulE family protein [Patescibacteria group bacterium UBA2163]
MQNGSDEAEAHLEDLRAKEEEELARILSQKYGVGYQDLTRISINTEALRLVPEKEAREAEAAAFDIVGKKVSLAVRSPQNNKVAAIVAALEKNNYTVDLFMVSQVSLKRAWERYKDLSFAIETRGGVFDISSAELDETMKSFKTKDDVVAAIDEVRGMKKAYRVSRILEVVLAGALSIHASDIHIEPEDEQVRLRYRLDGVLNKVTDFDAETYKLLLSRIKLLSGLKLNIHDEAQDGRFSIELHNTEIEIRTSVIPGAYGESIVLRVLDPEAIAVPFEELGMEPALRDLVKEEIRKPNGMLLTTGPTGSGKTTTLYACLKSIHTPNIKIITIEDPIEYHLNGIVQTQVDKNYTFMGGLRSALRQDPDVIMIGEIRDADVARTAIDSALTGHFVFSTLHTNNAAGAFPRLADFDIDLKVAGSAISVVLAQRLVRVLCPECKKEVALPSPLKEKVDAVLAGITDKSIIPENTEMVYEPVGCEKCNNTGYKGRIGIFEGIVVDKEVADFVRENPSEGDIQHIQNKRNLLTMPEDGVLKVLRGTTSLDELSRVVSIG